ncbi:DUF2934 domain-containing protein [Ancylobacter vacuolatus]|uniref:DUF2934 domain-containing protein n=1 Tax=Ancylobacter vacuolatus TaxID=223389 RepID=A0ABU0DGD2_9HYPH|nr:DUF2934 domain-containing protein [Ancylobacter vacuolatus]MDQ0347481.1 hypothetical protein [Ancylobacter vacuolatus]
MNIGEEAIRQRAHALWEAEGRPDGQAHDHWRRASEILEKETEGAGSGSGAFRPSDAAEVPPEAAGSPAPGPGFRAPSEDGGIEAAERPSQEPGIDPEVRTDPAQDNEPVTEIETIHRTLEIPKNRRGRTSPPDDRIGAMSGAAGSRKRS